MPRPIVEVLQTVATIQTTVTDPEQATLIVGPKYDVIEYDSASSDNSAAELAEEFNPYSFGDTGVFPTTAVVDLSDRGEIDASSIEVYLEDVFYEVGAVANSAVNSKFDGSAQDLTSYADTPDEWQRRLVHQTGSFSDSNLNRQLKSGDIVQIQYPFANVFVPNETDGFTTQELLDLRDPTSVLSVSIPSATVTDRNVLNHKNNSSVHSSALHVDLFEVFGEAGYGQVFSQLNATSDALAVSDGAACTLTITNGAVTHTVVGTLTVPAQSTTIDSLGNGASFLQTRDTLRQYVSAHLTDDLQQISCRIEAPLAADFPGNGESVFLPNADADWSYSATTGDITFNNAVTLRDTDLPNAASLTDKAITRATIFVSSRSLDNTQTNQILTVNSSDYVSVLGEATPDNPLSLAASIALQNSGTSTIKVLKISEDSRNGLLAALPIINANPDVYAILPLTQDLSVINSYAVAAVNQSAPAVGKFRIVLGSAESAPLWRYWAGTRANEYGWNAANVASGGITNAAKGTDVDGTAVIVDAEGGFLGDGGPAVGDTVVISSTVTGEEKVTCLVKSIDSNSQITIDLDAGVHFAEQVNADVFYTGASDIKNNRTAQVESLLGSIAPLTTNADLAKRLVMVYPGEVSVGEYAQLPGYYLTAAVGGMLAAFEPHRPKNQIAISGIADIEYSNLGYFSDDQIDALSDGGYFVMIQETPGGLPFCVHQVTAAYRQYAGTQEYSELSVVNNFDYVSSVFKNSLTPYVGVWNVIPQAYSSIFASLDSAILSLKARSADRIGSPLVSGDVVSVEPSEADQGTINVVMDVALPKVLNKIRLEVVSQ